MKICFRCGGVGTPEGCPNCKKILKKEEPGSEVAYGLKSTVDVDSWDGDRLIMSHPEIKTDTKFLRYVTILNSLYNQAKEGILTKKSQVLIAERGYGKHTFAQCMINALQKNGYSTCRIIDHSEYLRVNQLNAERPLNKQEISMSEVMYSDFCVMTIDGANRYTALRAMKSILDKRGSIGNVTYILSDYPLDMLETKYEMFKNIKYFEGRDTLRYCNLITSF